MTDPLAGTLFTLCIVVGLVLMTAGVAIALPTDDIRQIWIGASLCWLSLPCFWLASKVQRS